MKLKHAVAAIVLMLSFASPVVAGPFEDALDATKRGDYATALRMWRPLANQGDAFGQYVLGFMYYKGQGVPQDYAEAVKWFRLAASQGRASDQYNLGLMYYKGQGAPQNYAEAVKWYRLAANQGNSDAQFNLGVMYGTGRGVPQDHVSAHMWFNLAAAQGDTNAAKDRDTAAGFMTPAQIAEAQKLARDWKPTKQAPQ